MRAPQPFISSSVLIFAALVFTSGIPAFAGGPGDGAASPKPKPPVEKRIYTNDDLDAMAAQYGGPARHYEPTAESAPARVIEVSAEKPTPVNLPNERNPEWYAQQVVTLQAQLDAADNSIRELQQFRSSASTSSGEALRVGLGIYAPCDGITTDNQIQQLALRRQELAAKIDAMGNMARSNGFAPGMVRSSFEISQAAAVREGRAVTPAEAKAALAGVVRSLSDKLSRTQGTIASMNQEGASQSFTLLQPAPNDGGNMTTDLLSTLHKQVSVIRQSIGTIQDEAGEVGISPASLQ
jgi:hypothetical protein